MRLLLSVILLVVTSAASAQAEQMDTRGREFWLGFMQNASGTQQLSVKIASAQATTGTVSVPLAGWSTSFSIAANGVTSVVVPSIYEVTGSESVLDRGVHISSVEPVTVTAVNYQNQTTDATQVLPVKGLGTSYRVDALPGTSTAFPNGTYIFRSEMLIVATTDGTSVNITPSTTTTSGHAPNVPFTVDLNAGQVYQVQALNGLTDLTGTLVESTAASGPCRPFAVFGGSMCAVVSCAACDHANEQMMPVNTWGTVFHTVPLGNLTAWGYRILASEDNTLVTVDGGAPINLNAGASHQVLNTVQPVCISGNKPISVTQMMQGQTCAGIGDPSLLMLMPDDRMSTSVQFTTLFSTQSVIGHFISVVTPTGAISQLMLDGSPVSAAMFSTYPACAGLSYAKIFITAGTHRISSAAGFLAYAYGLASGESYMYGLSNNMAVPSTADSVICSSGPITLASPIVLANAQWTTASDPSTVLATGNSYTFTPDHNDVYRVDGEISPSGCPKHFEFHVGLPVQPQLNLSVNGTTTATVCQFTSVQLGTGSILDAQWFDLNWSPSAQMSDPNIPDPIAYPSASTWYKLQVTSPVGCGSAVDSVFVNVVPSTIFSLRAMVTNDTICSGNSTVLHAEVERVLYADAFEGGWASWWESVSGASTSAVCGSVSGTALYFNGSGVRKATSPPMDLSNGGMVHFALKIASGAAPCDDAEPGEDVVLEYSTNGTTWVLLSTFLENAYPSFNQMDVAVPALGASGSFTRLRWRQLANSGAGQDNWCMDNMLITLYEDPVEPLTWTPSATLSSNNSLSPTAFPTSSTWYKAQVTNAAGCTYVDSVRVTVAPAFSILPISDTTRCGVAGTQLQAHTTSGSGIFWSWSPANGLSSSTVANPIATPSATTNYTVTATNSLGCTDTEDVMVGVSGLTAATTSATDLTICHGAPVGLSANIVSTAPYSISWSPASVVQSPTSANTTATPNATTTFICTVTDTQTGCSKSPQVTVNVNPAYSVQLTNDTTVCTALGMQLHIAHNLTAPYQVHWSPAGHLNADNVAAPTILVDTTSTYVVTLTDQNGCSVMDSTTITVAFDNLITPVSVSTCAGQPLLLDAGFPGSSYDWNTNATTQTISVTQEGQYTATITDTNACQAIKSFVATFDPLPVVDLGPDLALCGVADHVLDAGNAGNNVVWNTGATTGQITVNTTGTYSATVTTPAGCQATDAMHVSINPLPIDMLQDVTSCELTPPTLSAGNPGSSYIWSTTETSANIVPTASGTYSVTVTTPQNCSAQFDAVVVLKPRVTVDVGPDLERCAGEQITLNAGSAPVQFLWNTGDVTSTLNVQASGTYIVNATNGYCSDSDTAVVIFNPVPVDNLIDKTACIGQTITLDAGNPGASFAWSSGQATQAITVTAQGQYAVTITGANGCEASYAATATFVNPPVVDLGADSVLCSGEWLLLDAGNPGQAYLWSNGATSRTIPVGSTGTYSVEVSNGYCSTSDEVHVIFNPIPDRLATHQYFTCLDEDPHYVDIDAGNPGSTFLWNGGQTTPVLHANGYGWKSVTITNAFGCSLTDSAMVNEFCRPTIFIPNTFTPNGDGRNDVWLSVGNNIGEYEMYVFDRWGGVIFHSTDVNTGWDGTISGQQATNDVYAFRLVYRLIEDSDGRLGFEQTRMGHVQVMR
ncbi:MAG: T9SS type B sorting domain-containing protein [Flavobacteriales bacterium]